MIPFTPDFTKACPGIIFFDTKVSSVNGPPAKNTHEKKGTLMNFVFWQCWKLIVIIFVYCTNVIHFLQSMTNFLDSISKYQHLPIQTSSLWRTVPPGAQLQDPRLFGQLTASAQPTCHPAQLRHSSVSIGVDMTGNLGVSNQEPFL